MPLLGFKKEFVPAVEIGTLMIELSEWDGVSLDVAQCELAAEFPEYYAGVDPKFQTIRAYRKDGRDPKPGDTLHLYTGLRTKAARKIGEVLCTQVQPVEMISDVGLCLDGDLPPPGERDAIAVADGFPNEAELVAWFRKVYGLPFRGLLIRWGAVR